MAARAGVPETLLVTGFLGAGKTTFIREHLAPMLAAGGRFAVLVNDFGEVRFDGPLLRRAGLAVVEVEGGCICCTAGGHLLDALHRIRSELAPDLLIVEGSGLADPWPLLEALHAEGFQVLGAPCLVDALAHARLRDDPLYLRQIDAATLLLVSKASLVASDALDAVKRFLAGRRPAAAVRILGCDDAGLQPLLSSAAAATQARRPRVHSAAERAWAWRPAGLPSLAALLDWLRTEPDIYRVKGVCQFAESVTPLALNWAFGHASTMAVAQDDPGALTFLGPAAGPALQRRLPACIAWDAGDLADDAPLPAGAFDRRPGIGYVHGCAVTELDAAEALLTFCDPLAAPLGLVVDAALQSLAAVVTGARVRIVLTDHRYATLRAAAARLVAAGAQRALVLTRSASAEVVASHFGAERTATFTPACCLQHTAVALTGLDARRAVALIDLLAGGGRAPAAGPDPSSIGGFCTPVLRG